jgi:hypothetical protein
MLCLAGEQIDSKGTEQPLAKVVILKVLFIGNIVAITVAAVTADIYIKETLYSLLMAMKGALRDSVVVLVILRELPAAVNLL